MATEATDPEKKEKKKWKKKQIFRKDNELDDAHLLEKSRMWHALHGNHLADFMGFDASLDGAYAADWLLKMEEFQGHPTDETMMDDIQQKESDVNDNIKAVLRKTDDVEYYARRAFPDNERRLLEFRFERLRKSCANYVPYLALLCYTMQLVVADYAAELALAGMPATLPGELETATTALALAERQLEYDKILRIRATTQRIKMFNELWGIHLLVRNAAKIIWRDNVVVAKQFE